MKYLSYRAGYEECFGCIVEGGIANLKARSGLVDLAAYISVHFNTLGEETDLVPEHSEEDVRFLPVITRPGKVLCVATNYHEAEASMDQRPQYPLTFTRFAVSQTGHDEPLPKPHVSDKFDYEGELAVIIGRTAHRVSEQEALAHVAGYSCFMDGSVRDWQKHSTQFTPGKNFAHTAGFGPYLVSADEVPNPAGLLLETYVNGELRQSNNTSRMIFSVAWLISYFSQFTILEPGDVIVTGTPSGFGSSLSPPVFLNIGDVVEVRVEGVGTLRNAVTAETDTPHNFR